MPIHDWTRVRSNRFHDFHQSWTISIRDALNRGCLPEGYFAMAEQITGGPEPDVVTLSTPTSHGPSQASGLMLEESPVRVRFKSVSTGSRYARKANRIAIYHPDGLVVAVIELVSPGNKDSRHAIQQFVRKAVNFLDAGINLLIVDLFPPTKRDPQGIHKLIWDRIQDDDEFSLPDDKPLTLASYAVGSAITSYVEPVAVGDILPDMPIFLSESYYIPCPLEATYMASWNVIPRQLQRDLVSS
jgi:hypothetical protein